MGFGCIFWLFLLSGFCLYENVLSKEWFVSRLHGSSGSECGPQSHPCKTIYEATARARDGDVINIDGAGTSRDPYTCETNSTEVRQLKIPSVIMRSMNTPAFITCKNSSLRFTCDVTMNATGVSLTGITFINASLNFYECSVKMADCSFVNGSNEAISMMFSPNSAANIFLDGCIFQNNSANGLKISGISVNLTISNSSFSNNKLHSGNDTILALLPQNLQVQQFTVNVTNVKVSRNRCHGHACFKIFAGVKGNLTLKMDEVIFEHNEIGESVLDVSGSSKAYVELKSTQFRENSGRAVKLHNGVALELKIVKGTFVDNKIGQRGYGGAVYVSEFTQNAYVSLSGSNFTSNRAEIGGALAFLKISVFLMLDIENCLFDKNEAQSAGGALAVGEFVNLPQNNATIDIRHTRFYGNSLQNGVGNHMQDFKAGHDWSAGEAVGGGVGGGGAMFLYINFVQNLSLTNNSFLENKAGEKNSGAIQAKFFSLYTDAVVSNCTFTGNSGGSYSGTLQFAVTQPTSLAKPAIIIQNSKFLENKGATSFYDLSLCSSNLIIRSCTIQSNSGGGMFFGTFPRNVLVEDSFISDNVNFVLYLYTDTIDHSSAYQFKNVSFENNDCKERSPMFRVSMYSSQSSLLFQASQFMNNFCKSGVVKIAVMQPVECSAAVWSTGVTINNTQFSGNSGVTESALTILDVETIDILNSNFTNNFGSTDGSHLYVQMRSSELKIYKTNFYQFKKSRVFGARKEQPYNGFLSVTSAGNMEVRDSSFILDTFSEIGEAIMLVKGAHQVAMNNSVKIKSPLGSKLVLHNFTHWEIERNISKPVLITSFSIITESCPVGTYSMNRGISNGFMIENHVKCYPCPAGGNCTTSLSARQNFWGYPIGDKVHFKFCPQGYCCPAVNQSCRYRNSSYLDSGCQGNRTGILCGRCKQNFSETLFTTNCISVKECKHWWYLVIVFICTTLFALFLIQKPPLFEMFMTHLTWFLPRHEQKNHGYKCLDSDADKEHSSSNAGYLKIFFYFYQIAGVLTASYYGVSEVLKDNIVLPMISLLDFKVTVNNNWNICPFPGITPFSKTLLPLEIVMITSFLSIPAIYLLHSGLNKLRKRTPVFPPRGPYLGAILEVQLLGYSATTGTAMKLLNCVQIQHVSRWYYNAEITCYQWWQYTSFLLIALFLVPFIFTLYFASSQLYKGQMTPKVFLLVYYFPVPYLLIILIRYIVKIIKRPRNYLEMKSSTSMVEDKDIHSPLSKEHVAVLEVLTAPFCKPKDGQLSGTIHWECVLIGRRFILILIGSFVEHAFLRSVCLTILCVFFLLHHVIRKPFVHHRANLAETVSLTTLVVIATLNIGVASYYSEGTEARGVRQQQYIQGFLITESILLCFVPVVFAVFVSLSLLSQFVRLAIILVQALRSRVFKSKTLKHSTQLGQVKPLLSSIA